MAAAVPGFDLAKLPGAVLPAPAPAPAPASTLAPQVSPQPRPPEVPAGPEAAERASGQAPGFAELFGDLGSPVLHAAPAAGAVDVRKIEPAKPKPRPEPVKPPPKPAPPSHPSRIWVQLGVGQNVAALKYDWRKLTRTQAALFKGRKAYVSDFGRTNRMLTGPFETRKAANDFLASLGKAGLAEPYLWISPAGQIVDHLPE